APRELNRETAGALDQADALGALLGRWTGGDGDGQPRVTDEFDRPPEPAKDDRAKDDRAKDDRAKDGDTKDDKIKDGAKEEKA
ncbi:hypothetical protein ACFWIZ_32245, partial [Streptomyces sp. NPDC127044]